MTLACLILISLIADGPTEPGRVSLNFRDKPIQEVVRSIGDQGGNPLSLSLAGIGDANDRPVTLESPQPVPFWEAVDRLCEAVGLRSQINESGTAGVQRWNVSLFGPEKPDPSLSVYSGPFRFSRLSVHAISDRDFLRNGDLQTKTTSQTHYAEFDVLAEPRVIAVRTGSLTHLQAVDDRGKSLLEEGVPDERRSPMVPGYEVFRSYPQRIRLDLRAPSSPGGRLKVLRGEMPLEVSLVPAQPARVIELAGSVGKTLTVGDVTVVVESFEVKATTPARVVVKAQITGDRGDSKRWSNEIVRARNMALSRQIEVADAVGPLAPSAEGQAFDGTSLRLDYTFSPRQPGGESSPTHLRVYLPEWVAWNAPFAFDDVPLP